MSTTPQPPSNYQWNGNNLSYSLPADAVGLELKYKKDGETEWSIVYISDYLAPTSVYLPSTVGPTGTIYGRTTKNSTGGWGPPSQLSITNTP